MNGIEFADAVFGRPRKLDGRGQERNVKRRNWVTAFFLKPAKSLVGAWGQIGHGVPVKFVVQAAHRRMGTEVMNGIRVIHDS